MRVIVFGTGTVARGVLGFLFSKAGYEVIFVDGNEDALRYLNEEREYPVRIEGAYPIDTLVRDVQAIAVSDIDKVAEAIEQCDIIATAVGSGVIRHIVPVLKEGLRRRMQRGIAVDVLLCEDFVDAPGFLQQLIAAEMDDLELQRFKRTVGLVEGYIVGMTQTFDWAGPHPLAVRVWESDHVILNQNAFVGPVLNIPGVTAYEEFEFYRTRHLVLQTLCRTMVSCLGLYMGYHSLCQAAADPIICLCVQNALLESAVAMSRKYDFEIGALLEYSYSLLWGLKYLQDTPTMPGENANREATIRELALHELSPYRSLLTASKLCEAKEVPPAFVTLGIACALNTPKRSKEYDVQKVMAQEWFTQGCKEIKLCEALLEALEAGEPLQRVYELAEKWRNSKLAG